MPLPLIPLAITGLSGLFVGAIANKPSIDGLQKESTTDKLIKYSLLAGAAFIIYKKVIK